jgi:hypothetical protein
MVCGLGSERARHHSRSPPLPRFLTVRPDVVIF